MQKINQKQDTLILMQEDVQLMRKGTLSLIASSHKRIENDRKS